MSFFAATWLVRLLAIYAAVGVVFAPAFLLVGVKRIDPVAAQGTWGFRLLILPGVIALWPILLRRWLAGQRVPPEERNPHRLAAARRGGES